MKNNKGQVLVLFILLIPVFLLLFAVVIDVGMMYNKKKQLESAVRESVSYGLKKLDELEIRNKIKMLIEKNVSESVEVTIYQEIDYLQVRANQQYRGLFPFLFQNSLYEMEVTYYGYPLEDDVIIHKE